MGKKKSNEREQFQDDLQRDIDLNTETWSRSEYREFLEWLQAEAECRLMALDEDAPEG